MRHNITRYATLAVVLGIAAGCGTESDAVATDSVTFTVAGPPPSGSTSVIPVRLTLPPSFNEKDADEDCGWGIWSVIGFQFLETAQSKVEFRLGGDTEVTWPYTTLYNSVQVVRKVFKLPLTQEKC